MTTGRIHSQLASSYVDGNNALPQPLLLQDIPEQIILGAMVDRMVAYDLASAANLSLVNKTFYYAFTQKLINTLLQLTEDVTRVWTDDLQIKLKKIKTLIEIRPDLIFKVGEATLSYNHTKIGKTPLQNVFLRHDVYFQQLFLEMAEKTGRLDNFIKQYQYLADNFDENIDAAQEHYEDYMDRVMLSYPREEIRAYYDSLPEEDLWIYLDAINSESKRLGMTQVFLPRWMYDAFFQKNNQWDVNSDFADTTPPDNYYVYQRRASLKHNKMIEGRVDVLNELNKLMNDRPHFSPGNHYCINRDVTKKRQMRICEDSLSGEEAQSQWLTFQSLFSKRLTMQANLITEAEEKLTASKPKM